MSQPPTDHPTSPLSGVWPVLVTPFDKSLRIVADDLSRQVEWVIAAGVDGIVYPGVVSEFFALSEGERRECLRQVVRVTQSRVPVIAGVSATSAPVAAELARDAQEVGAIAVMAMMPYVSHFFAPSERFALQYFQSIADACSIPIVLQNARIGHPLNAATVRVIVEQIPGVRYVKEENFPSTHTLAATITALGNEIDGVFGGLGGIYLSQELIRGAVGTMPSPVVVDALVHAYKLWARHDGDELVRLLAALAEFSTLELLYNVAFIKEVMRRRGVITNVATRVPVPALDEVDMAEIEAALERVSPWLVASRL